MSKTDEENDFGRATCCRCQVERGAIWQPVLAIKKEAGRQTSFCVSDRSVLTVFQAFQATRFCIAGPKGE